MNLFLTRYQALRFLAVLSLTCALPGCDKDRDNVYPEGYSPPPTRASYSGAPIYTNAPRYSSVQPAPVIVPPTVIASTAAPMASLGGIPEIRVAVQKDAQSIRVSAPASGARIVLNGQPWKQLPANAVVNVSQAGGALLLEGTPVAASAVRFESFSPDAFMKVNEHDISACVVLSHPAGRSGLLAVAQLSVEDYLAGVLAGEVPYERWHPEALKAQAVVSRTYALNEIRAHAGEAYDVESTIMSQVFKGGYRNIPALSMAINGTRGQALTSAGTVFPAFFHSTCGGHTEAAGGIFPEHSGVRPLCGVTCPYCAQSPSYRWNARFTKEALAAKLHGAIPNMGKLESFTFSDAKGQTVGEGGDFRRVQTVTVRHSNGSNTLQGNVFRLAVGPKELKSLLWGQVADRGDAYDISGGGFGHGVGLCQYGSQGMALTGESYTRILGFYFPGAALTRLY